MHDDPIDWLKAGLNPPPDLDSKKLRHVEHIVALARDAGVILPGGAIEFEHQLTQEYFCFVYFSKHAIDEKFLKHAGQRQFAQVWRLWAQ